MVTRLRMAGDMMLLFQTVISNSARARWIFIVFGSLSLYSVLLYYSDNIICVYRWKDLTARQWNKCPKFTAGRIFAVTEVETKHLVSGRFVILISTTAESLVEFNLSLAYFFISPRGYHPFVSTLPRRTVKYYIHINIINTRINKFHHAHAVLPDPWDNLQGVTALHPLYAYTVTYVCIYVLLNTGRVL